MKDVQVRGLESDGVTLISPMAPEFDSIAEALAPQGFAEVAKEAKPYVVIVVNNSPRSIVAMTLASSNAEGQGTPSPVFVSFTGAAEQNQLFIAPNAVETPELILGTAVSEESLRADRG